MIVIYIYLFIFLATICINNYFNFFYMYNQLDYDQKFKYFKNTKLINYINKHKKLKRIIKYSYFNLFELCAELHVEGDNYEIYNTKDNVYDISGTNIIGLFLYNETKQKLYIYNECRYSRLFRYIPRQKIL